MTLKKLIRKYVGLCKQGYETIIITQVINDLRQVGSIGVEICKHCGKPENDSKHIRYGPDLDNPVKHQFEPRG